jgi:hypothetical protein
MGRPFLPSALNRRVNLLLNCSEGEDTGPGYSRDEHYCCPPRKATGSRIMHKSEQLEEIFKKKYALKQTKNIMEAHTS